LYPFIEPGKSEDGTKEAEVGDPQPVDRSISRDICKQPFHAGGGEEHGTPDQAGIGDGRQGGDFLHGVLTGQGIEDPAHDASEDVQLSSPEASLHYCQGVALRYDDDGSRDTQQDPGHVYPTQLFLEEEVGEEGDENRVHRDNNGGTTCSDGLQAEEEEYVVGEYAGHAEEDDGDDLMLLQAGESAFKIFSDKDEKQ